MGFTIGGSNYLDDSMYSIAEGFYFTTLYHLTEGH